MHIDLTGKQAVVGGSTGGIGRTIAEGLARAGPAVVINGRGEQRVARALSEMRGGIPGAELEGVAVLVGRAPTADILVNNVGTAVPKPFEELEDADWLDLFQLNVMSGVHLTRHYLPAMVKKGWGRVVFISSESAVNIPKEMINYGMTKTAQLAISRGVAESVAGSGVTVNSVLPGPTRSEGIGRFLGAAAERAGVTQEVIEQQFLETLRPTSLIGRFATTEEVANMVVYLCSEQASATTGAALRVDGGVVRFIA